MLPVYGIASFASLLAKSQSFFIDTIRDIYEGFVIYSFFILLVNYLGGERELLIKLRNRLRVHHMFPVNLILKPMDVSILIDDEYQHFLIGKARGCAVCGV